MKMLGLTEAASHHAQHHMSTFGHISRVHRYASFLFIFQDELLYDLLFSHFFTETLAGVTHNDPLL